MRYARKGKYAWGIQRMKLAAAVLSVGKYSISNSVQINLSRDKHAQASG